MTDSATLPLIIQGGMGIGVSNWQLARAVSLCGQLGVVSGTAVDSVLVRRLQDGDSGGHVRRALSHFPAPADAADVLRRYFRAEGRAADMPYKLLPMYRQVIGRPRQMLTVIANFVEVFLAKESHDGAIGINLLTKVQLPTLPSLYGAMLAGVDYVLMGAGIPKEIPGALDRLANHDAATLRLDVEAAARDEAEFVHFDPRAYWDRVPAPLRRPRFLAIVASSSLATMLARKSNGRVDGFVVEAPSAGGHNAPPRGGGSVNERGEPVYGARDALDVAAMRALCLPFWLAGGLCTPDALPAALDAGAAGIQVGTLFAYTAESGLDPTLRDAVIEQVKRNDIDVFTDARASATGYPFKVVQLAGTNAMPELYAARERVCDLGYLRVPYRTGDGRLGYRCAAEPVETYVAKGGRIEDTAGRKCLCNALLANIGMPQIDEHGAAERALLTSGDVLPRIAEFLGERSSYSAADVVEYLLQRVSVDAAVG